MEIRAYPILNSKAEPTLEVVIEDGELRVTASPPSGTSRSSKEVVDYPGDGPIERRVELSLKRFPELSRLAKEANDPLDFEDMVRERLDYFGGSSVLALSLALHKYSALLEGEPLYRYLSHLYGTKPSIPLLLENVVGGGKHGGSLPVQEVLLIGEDPFELATIYRDLREKLKELDPSFRGTLTYESAWAPDTGLEEVLDVLSSHTLGLDVAANDLFEGNAYRWGKRLLTREEHMEYLLHLLENYPIVYIEDPFEENDVEGFVELQRKTDATVVGDDLFATDADRLVEGIGGVIIKYNQRGLLSEAVRTVKRARALGMRVIVSHRSGETEDPFLTHFAVAMGADLFKLGAAGIRIVKINELIRLYNEL